MRARGDGIFVGVTILREFCCWR